jgi:serine/threonine protein kinase
LNISSLPKSLPRESFHAPSSTNSSTSNPLLEKAFNAARTGDCEYLRNLFSLPSPPTGDGSRESPLDVNAQLRNGWTLLMEASAVGKFDVVNLLLSFGVNTEARNKKGQTALHEAVKNGYLRAARALLDGGACMNAVTRKGLTIEEIAESHGHTTLLAYLVNRRSNLMKPFLKPDAFPNTIPPEGDSSSRVVNDYSAQSLPSYLPRSSLSSSSSTSTIRAAIISSPLSSPPPPPLPLMERNQTYPTSTYDNRDRFNLHSWLMEIGLGQYGAVLDANGFDSIPSLELLTDSDLTVMGFLLGHKKLFLGEYAKLHLSHPFLFIPREIILPMNTEEEYQLQLLGDRASAAVTPPLYPPPQLSRQKQRLGQGQEESPHEIGKKKSRRRRRNKKSPLAMNLESADEKTAGNVKPPRPETAGKKQSEASLLHYTHADNLLLLSPLPRSSPVHRIESPAEDSILSKDSFDDNLSFSINSHSNGSPNQHHPSVKELRYEELEVGPVIGEGSFGTVRSGWWRGMHVAIKALRLIDNVCDPCPTAAAGKRRQQEEEEEEQCEVTISQRIKELRHEAMTMSRVCNHSYVINFIGIITSPIPCVVTSFCSNGSMEDLLFKSSYKCQINSDTLLRFAMETAQGIQHLHLEGIIHRDLAARNLLIDENFHVRVADFGFARIKEELLSKGYTQSDMGPIRWSAPEAMRNKQYSDASDVFSYGVVLYEMFTQCMPWEGYETLDVAIRVCSGERMMIPETVPRDISDLMILCWSHEPICRPSMSEIIQCLQLMRNQVALLDRNNQEFLWMLHEGEGEEEGGGGGGAEEGEEGEGQMDLLRLEGSVEESGQDWLRKWYFNEGNSPAATAAAAALMMEGDDDHQRLLNHYHIMTPNISRDNSET